MSWHGYFNPFITRNDWKPVGVQASTQAAPGECHWSALVLTGICDKIPGWDLESDTHLGELSLLPLVGQEVSTGQGAVAVVCIWEGSRRRGFNWPCVADCDITKEDEHPLVGVQHPLPF